MADQSKRVHTRRRESLQPPTAPDPPPPPILTLPAPRCLWCSRPLSITVCPRAGRWGACWGVKTEEGEDRGMRSWKQGWMDGGREWVRGRREGGVPLRASRGCACINHSTGGEGDSDGWHPPAQCLLTPTTPPTLRLSLWSRMDELPSFILHSLHPSSPFFSPPGPAWWTDFILTPLAEVLQTLEGFPPLCLHLLLFFTKTTIIIIYYFLTVSSSLPPSFPPYIFLIWCLLPRWCFLEFPLPFPHFSSLLLLPFHPCSLGLSLPSLSFSFLIIVLHFSLSFSFLSVLLYLF